MKRIVSILALILAFAAIFMTMVSCNDDNENNGGNTDPVYQDYTVKVVDGLGNPVSDIIVNFYTPSGDKKMRVTDKTGVATLKNVEAGDYEIIIEQGFSSAIITDFKFNLTAEVTELTVIVRDESKTMDIYGDIPDGSFAYNVVTGSYNVYCNADEMSYLVFNPQKSGVYRFSIPSSEDATIGYYGIHMFVQAHHCGEGEYDGKTFELVIQDEATPYVIGVLSKKQANVELKIERTGDAPFDPQFAPWTVVESKFDVTKCDLPENVKLKDIDITSKDISVYLGDDGYYHTSDGSILYLRIGSVCDAKYLDVSLAFIAGHADANFGQNFGGYVYDENGEFVAKYSYNSLLSAYCGSLDDKGAIQGNNCDETGVYPLTAELAEAIKCHGNAAGWWKPNTVNYLFNGVPVNLDIAWLFLCCTVE